MNKLTTLCAIAALMLPVITSCDKQEMPKKDDVTMTSPAMSEYAKYVVFSDLLLESAPEYECNGETYMLVSLEFTESGRYIARRIPVLTDNAVSLTKSNVFWEAVTGRYNVTDNTYKCIGKFPGLLEINGSDVTFTPEGGQPMKLKAKIKKTTSTSKTQVNIARAWNVDNTIVKIAGKKANVETSFSGCNLYDIAKYASENGVEGLDANRLAGYEITELSFTGQGNMVIDFKNGDTYYGTYTLDSNKLEYTLLLGGNDILAPTAHAVITFPENNKSTFLAEISIDGYGGFILLTLKQAD